jgi:hypothetical protein
MRMNDRIRALETENAVLRFNAEHNIGTPVRFWTGVREGQGRVGTTWTEAQIMGGHTSVVYIRDLFGKNVGSVSLTHVDLLTSDEISEMKKQFADAQKNGGAA